MALLVGLTGGMGSGKSSAASLFGDLGAFILDADAICQELMKPDQSAWQEIVSWLGQDYLNPDRSLNRAKIAQRVFENPSDKEKLESILHPRVFEYEQDRFKELENADPQAIVLIDAALLIESGNYRNVDEVVVVSCDDDLRFQRIMGSGKFTDEDVRRRMKNQWPLDEKLKYADHVIDNNGDLKNLKLQVEQLYLHFQSKVR